MSRPLPGTRPQHPGGCHVLQPGTPEELLLGFLAPLLARRGPLLGLAVPDAAHAVAASDPAQRGEAEPPAALHHLGPPVDGDHAFEVRALLLLGRPATAALAAVP